MHLICDPGGELRNNLMCYVSSLIHIVYDPGGGLCNTPTLDTSFSYTLCVILEVDCAILLH